MKVSTGFGIVGAVAAVLFTPLIEPPPTGVPQLWAVPIIWGVGSIGYCALKLFTMLVISLHEEFGKRETTT